MLRDPRPGLDAAVARPAPCPRASPAGSVPGTVPGTVHTDLLAAGLIVDPYLATSTRSSSPGCAAPTGGTSVRSTLEPAADDERVDLVFDGLDTVATITLGGVDGRRTANMHRSYRFDVRARWPPATTTLAVRLRQRADARRAGGLRIGARPEAYPDAVQLVRKMACSFGWDWGPDLQTAGIWKPGRACSAGAPRGWPRSVRWHDRRRPTAPSPCTSTSSGPGRTPPEPALDRPTSRRRRSVVVGDPPPGRRPRSRRGRRPRRATAGGRRATASSRCTTLEVELHRPATTRLDSWHRRVGFRTVALDTTPDEHGTAFALVVNGRPVFARGANWIPDDHLLTRHHPRSADAGGSTRPSTANANLLRVWGGGIYETDDFYDVCDERGVMVWQDFLFACAAYPEEEPHCAPRSRPRPASNVDPADPPHPTLVIWNGGNENLWGYEDWGWQEPLDGRDLGRGLLPRPAARRSSPSSTRPGRTRRAARGRARRDPHPNDPDHGTHPRVGGVEPRDYTDYRDRRPALRAPSSAGRRRPPGHARAGASATTPLHARTSPGVPAPPEGRGRQRQARPRPGTAPAGCPRLRRLALGHAAQPGPGRRARGRALPLVLAAHARAAIVWQLNDCWPVTSWAAVDGDGRRKPLWYALRRVVRRPAAHRAGARRRRRAGSGQRLRPAVGRVESRVRRERVRRHPARRCSPSCSTCRRGTVTILDLPADVRSPARPARRGARRRARRRDRRRTRGWTTWSSIWTRRPADARGAGLGRLPGDHHGDVARAGRDPARGPRRPGRHRRRGPDHPPGRYVDDDPRPKRSTGPRGRLVRTPVLRSANEVSRTHAAAS